MGRRRVMRKRKERMRRRKSRKCNTDWMINQYPKEGPVLGWCSLSSLSSCCRAPSRTALPITHLWFGVTEGDRRLCLPDPGMRDRIPKCPRSLVALGSGAGASDLCTLCGDLGGGGPPLSPHQLTWRQESPSGVDGAAHRTTAPTPRTTESWTTFHSTPRPRALPAHFGVPSSCTG